MREALRETTSSLEENKADILGLHLVRRLIEAGEIPDGDIQSNYVTFMAGIFRSIRFGAASAHGRANVLSFNFLRRSGAVVRDSSSGTYRVDAEKMRVAVDALAGEILTIQGDGAYARARNLLDEMGTVDDTLQSDLARLEESEIPVDVVFDQSFALALVDDRQ